MKAKTCGRCRHMTANPIATTNGLHGCNAIDRIGQRVATCPAVWMVYTYGVKPTMRATKCRLFKAKGAGK
jgi:hypothetical protein